MNRVSPPLWRSMLLALSVILPVNGAVSQVHPTPDERVYAPTEPVFGKTYAEWNAIMTQKTLALPFEKNPGYGPAEKVVENLCAMDQDQAVWFIATPGQAEYTFPCPVPSDKAVLLPLLAWISVRGFDVPTNATDAELIANAKAMSEMIAVESLSATINGTPITDLAQYRAESGIFPVTIGEGGVAGYTAGNYDAIINGYNLLLKPLPVGEHVLTAHAAAVSDGTVVFEVNPTFRITVVPAGSGGTLKGDTNGDGAIRINDALMALRSIIDALQLSTDQAVRSDMNGDGAVRLEDVRIILSKAIGL